MVRKTVVPASRERADDVPQLPPAAGVEPGRRLVEEEHLGCDDEAEREVEAPPHAAGVGADALVGGIRQIEALEQLRRARLRGGGRDEPREPAEHHEVLGAGEHVVDGGGLAGEADPLLAPARGRATTSNAGDDRACPRRGGRGS